MHKARTEEELLPPYQGTMKHRSVLQTQLAKFSLIRYLGGKKFCTINGNLKIYVMHRCRIQILDCFHSIGIPDGDVYVDTGNISVQ